MMHSCAIVGKSGSGRTFVATHVAAALAYMGVRTLLVGCDTKPDAARAFSSAPAPSLLQAFQEAGGPPPGGLNTVVATITPYLDVMETGPTPLGQGNHGQLLQEVLDFLDGHDARERYQHIVFDLNEERFDSAWMPVLKAVSAVIGVTTEDPGALFVLNRMARGVLLANYEGDAPARLLGVINNRSLGTGLFRAYVERTRFFPLVEIPEHSALGALRATRQTLFSFDPEPREFKAVVDGLVQIGDAIRTGSYAMQPAGPLEDDVIWQLGASAGLRLV